MDLTQKTKQKLRAVEFIFLIYLLVNVFPYSLLFRTTQWLDTIRVLVMAVFLVYFFYYMKKEDLSFPQLRPLKKQSLFILPLLLMTVSNLIYLWISKQPLQAFDSQSFWASLPLLVLMVASEELIFRGLWMDTYLQEKPLFQRVLWSSIVFGLMHLIHLFSNVAIGSVFLQVGYTFALGFVCATSYALSQNILIPILLHLAFNLFNNSLYEQWVSVDPDWLYYVMNGTLGIVMLGYCCWLIFIYAKKKQIQ